MSWFLSLIPLLTTGATIGTTAASLASQGAGSQPTPMPAPTTPAAAPTPNVNPSLATTALANLYSSNPYANPGLAQQSLSQLFGVGTNQPITTGFTPSGVGSGTPNPVAPQTPYYLSDLVNQVLGG